MKYRFLSLANLEMLDAAEYYEERRSGLGEDFLNEIQAAIQKLLQFPELGTPTIGNCRKLPIADFPYSIVYARQNDTLLLIAIMHQHRKPGYWKGRI